MSERTNEWNFNPVGLFAGDLFIRRLGPGFVDLDSQLGSIPSGCTIVASSDRTDIRAGAQADPTHRHDRHFAHCGDDPLVVSGQGAHVEWDVRVLDVLPRVNSRDSASTSVPADAGLIRSPQGKTPLPILRS